MKRLKLDLSRSYAVSYGTKPDCAFSQDGKKFDGGGLEIVDEDQQGTVPDGLRNADERQALINKTFAETSGDEVKVEGESSTEGEPGTVSETLDNDGDQQEGPTEKNIDDKLSDVYGTRETIMEALDELMVDYNKRERKSVLLDRLKVAIEKKDGDNA